MNFLKRIFGKDDGEESRKKFAFQCYLFSNQFLGALKYSGEKYAELREVRRNEGEMIAFLEFSSSFGDPIALFCRGEFYERGVGTTSNLDKAIIYYRRAYHEGDLPALPYWVEAALKNRCSQHESEEFVGLVESERQNAADFNDVLLTIVGDRRLYTEHECILYRLALAGDADAQLKLARHWIGTRNSWRRSENFDRRQRVLRGLLESAARQGSAEAQFRFSTILAEDNAPVSECLTWAALAARQGFSEAVSFLATAAKTHGDDILDLAQQAANAVTAKESNITWCATATKSLLASNNGVFPKDWESLIQHD